ncbi:N-alpha-acetyltransferase 30 [Chionoecetes opilio]|uniref:N-alpha-acetyltransferase 30 n=1 Tax=Chionoecetes opilio TaxID=41210 RepID=A0A8J5CMF5_CHIOP|nr:N-alpha-acetyltransferase 30 [Chionoecetes opilio]
MREAPLRRVLLQDTPSPLACHTVPAQSADLAPVHGARARTAHTHAHAFVMEKRPMGERGGEGGVGGVAADLRDKLTLRAGVVNGIKIGTTDAQVHVPALKYRPIAPPVPPPVPPPPVPEEQCSESSQESKSDLNGAVCNGHTVSEATSSGSIAVSDSFSLASERSSDSSLSLSGARPRTRHTSGGSQGTLSTPAHDLSSASDSLVTPEICISPLPPAAVMDDLRVEYVNYQNELQMSAIMRLIQKDLSEPYSIYTYRYFIHNWPKLCFLAVSNREVVGAIVCKLDVHKKVTVRGYIAMLAVDHRFRKRKIGSNLVQRAIRAMASDDADEVVLETEITNKPALRLYENLGFVRDKRLFR